MALKQKNQWHTAGSLASFVERDLFSGGNVRSAYAESPFDQNCAKHRAAW